MKTKPSIKPALLDILMSDWPTIVQQMGVEPFRAGQIAEWIFKKGANDFDRMSNLPQTFRKALDERYRLRSLELDKALTSAHDGTTRYFFKTADKEATTCVFLPFEDRRSLCISTQVGCAWGCVFCASGLVALKRNLTVGEILDQILLVQEIQGSPITSVLFMGMGEPLANYKNLVGALQLIRSPLGLGMGSRHVTVSTCGLVPQIETLAVEAPKVNLAISLHATRDELRKKLLPKASHWTIKELLRAAKTFSMKTGAPVTFEYIVIAGVNDEERDIQRLANMMRNLVEHGDYWVNLIAYNPVPGLPYKKPTDESMDHIKEILKSRDVPVRLRKPQGVDIGAGCGQLGEGR